MLLAVPLLAVTASLDAGFTGVFVAASAVCALNRFCGIGRVMGWAIPRMTISIDSSVLLASANVVPLVRHARVLMRGRARSAGSDTVLVVGDTASRS